MTMIAISITISRMCTWISCQWKDSFSETSRNTCSEMSSSLSCRSRTSSLDSDSLTAERLTRSARLSSMTRCLLPRDSMASRFRLMLYSSTLIRLFRRMKMDSLEEEAAAITDAVPVPDPPFIGCWGGAGGVDSLP